MRYQTFSDINFTNHHLIGFEWPMVSSRTGEVYKVIMTPRGFSCNCIAGSMRGKCKHAQEVHDKLVYEPPFPKDEF